MATKVVKTEYPVLDEGTLAAYLVKDGDGYAVTDLEGNVLGTCGNSVSKGTPLITIPANPSNRKFYVVAKAEKEFEATDKIELCYKATKHVGSVGSKLPNAKLIAYLPENLQAEYKSIVERARALMEADRKQPKTELEKAQAQLAKAQAKLDALIAEANAEGINLED